MANADVLALNDSNGNGGAGTPALPDAACAMFYDAHIFGLSKDYAFPIGANVDPSRWHQITNLARLLTRKQTLADGNDYDLWDAVMTIAKSIVEANPHINDDEPLSKNYGKQGS